MSKSISLNNKTNFKIIQLTRTICDEGPLKYCRVDTFVSGKVRIVWHNERHPKRLLDKSVLMCVYHDPLHERRNSNNRTDFKNSHYLIALN